MQTQSSYSINPGNRLAQDPLRGWPGVLLALALAILIAFAAYLVAQPVVVNRAANGMAQSAPDAAAQSVAGYLAAHDVAGPAERADGVTGALPGPAVCPITQNVGLFGSNGDAPGSH